MRVSVVIPIFNAEKFLAKAIESCLIQPETAEVILADDGSMDGSISIAENFIKKDPRVKLVFHPNKENRGTGASRNLGIINSTSEFVSFLDNDDFYLPGRFTKAKELFENNPEIDGVYEAIGTFPYDQQSLEIHMKRMKDGKYNHSQLELTTMDIAAKPEDLFEVLLLEKNGWFHVNGITLKKTVFVKTGLHDEEFIWSEDTEFFYRLCYYGKLMAGRLTEPVAMRGIYIGNRTLTPHGDERARFFNVPLWKKMFVFMLDKKLSKAANRYILMRHLDFFNHTFAKRKINFKRKIVKGLHFAGLIIKHPKLLGKL
ncbi:MAG: glycosyltransferase family 2 protein [Bacteroidetes bacterium]|nr:glycosyltransferase family 2 protein [Bacteroidota bacterium]